MEPIWQGNRSRRVVRSAAAGFLLAALALSGCSEEETKQGNRQGPAPSVVVSPVTEREVSGRLEYVGRVLATSHVNIFARVKGFLTARLFEEGGQVAAGSLLFKIDPAEFETEVAAAAADVKRAKASYDLAMKELARARKLSKRGNISESTLDQRAAEAARNAADIDAAQANLTRAKLDLGYTQVTSPIAGRIGRASIDEGNLVGPDSGALASIVALDPIYVTFAVSERELIDYRQASERGEARIYVPSLRLPNGTDFGHQGEINFVDNKVDPSTGTIQIRALFPNPDALLLPGVFVTVNLRTETTRRKVVIPQVAVQENQTGRFVLVVDRDDTVALRPVKMGQRTGREWIVEDGLEPGETIIIEGIQKARPGAKVNPVASAGSS